MPTVQFYDPLIHFLVALIFIFCEYLSLVEELSIYFSGATRELRESLLNLIVEAERRTEYPNPLRDSRATFNNDGTITGVYTRVINEEDHIRPWGEESEQDPADNTQIPKSPLNSTERRAFEILTNRI